MIKTALLIGVLAAQPGNVISTLVGRWDAEARSRGGLGTWVELARDGTCSETTGAMVDGTWKLNGDQLTVSIPDPGGPTPDQKTTVALQGDVLVQTAAGQTRRLQRSGGPTKPGTPIVVGVWTYEHPAGGRGYDEYVADSRFLFRLPMRSNACRWSVDGDSLSITTGGTTQRTRWSVMGDRLTLVDGSTSRSFHRERSGIIPPPQPR